MSAIIKTGDEKKWINAFVAIASVIIGYIMIRFTQQLGEWFDLESKISHFMTMTQGLGVLSGITTFLVIIKSKKYSTYLHEVYGELVKVVWPNKDAIIKLTVGIVIALSIISGILVLIDYIFRKLLSFVY